jgi:eukaryotic-like serine/threonine-protein kinase
MDFGEIPPERARELDILCDRFEADWRAGPRPRIEACLALVPAAFGRPLFGMLLATELEIRRRRGEQPVPSEYYSQFPGQVEQIDLTFAHEGAQHSRPPGKSRPEVTAQPPHQTNPVISVIADGRALARPVAAPAGRRLEFIARAGEHPATIQHVLRNRLRFLCRLITALFVALIVLVDRTKLQSSDPQVASDGLAYFWAHLAMAVAALALLPVLRSRHAASLARLRTIEIVLFVALCGEFSWIEWHELHDPLTRRLTDVAGIAASAASIGWFVIIVFYGTFIPNDWRRCARAVSLIAACPLVTALVATVTTESVRWFVFGPFVVYLTLWMTLAAAIVTYGAHRVDVLQQEATEARQFGQYHVRALLKSGGMGDVYLAEHMMMRRPCAIKLIRPERAGDPDAIRRFEREVRAMARLNHWNTVQIFDYGHTDDGTFYYVMEYLPGLNLEEMVKRDGPLPPGRVVHFLTQICHALREAHSIKLIHRDIKPSNILACQRGGDSDVVKLLDFGLVRQISAAADDFGASAQRGCDVGMTIDTGRGGVAGTPHYMSPEQIMASAQIDERSDIYSTGALAYFSLTGRPPFVGPHLDGVLDAQLYDEVEPPSRLSPGLPVDLEAIILTCLSKKPADRFPNVEALETALEECGCAGAWTAEMADDWWEKNFVPEPSE